MTIKKAWLWIAGAAFIPLAALGSTTLQTTIAQNGAPIAIDHCVVTVQNPAASSGDETLSEDVGFTNVSQQTVTEVDFGFDVVDTSGLHDRKLINDKAGSFAPGAGIDDSGQIPAGDVMSQTISLPHAAQALCSVQMVRFRDGTTWHDGDGPAGSGPMYTPLPGPTPTTQWQWPYDTPAPRG